MSGFERVEQWPEPPAFGDWRSADWQTVALELVKSSRDEAVLRGALLKHLYALGAPADVRRAVLKSAVESFRQKFERTVEAARAATLAIVKAAGAAGVQRSALDGVVQQYGHAAVAVAIKRSADALVSINGRVLSKDFATSVRHEAARSADQLAKAYGTMSAGTRRSVPPGTVHEWISSSGGRIRAMKQPNGIWKILHRTGPGHHEDAKVDSEHSPEKMREMHANHQHAGAVAGGDGGSAGGSAGSAGHKSDGDDTKPRKQTRLSSAKKPGRSRPMPNATNVVKSMDEAKMDEKLANLKKDLASFQEMSISADDKPFEQQLAPAGENEFGTRLESLSSSSIGKGGIREVDLSKSMGLAGIPGSETRARIMSMNVPAHELHNRESAHMRPWACPSCKTTNLSMVTVCNGCGHDLSGVDAYGTPGGGVSIVMDGGVSRALGASPADHRRGMINVR